MTRARKLLFACTLSVVAAIAIAIPAAAALGFFTSVKPYAKVIDPSYEIKPLISAGDRVPQTSNPSNQYQMVGIPDGLGIAKTGGPPEVYMNHELGRTVSSTPVIGGTALRGAFVSKYRFASDASVISGDKAYTSIYNEDTYVGPIPAADNATAAFARFCSGFMADSRVGFTQPIYITGEESGGADTYSGTGGSAVAVYNNQAHLLPKLGFTAKENLIVAQKTGDKTVIFSMEDGPSTPDSQLYMYVGTKVPGATSVLRRNGLDNGKLYVLTLNSHTNEADFSTGTSLGGWTEIPNADTLTDVQLETAADAAGAFGFIRTEDGAISNAAPSFFNFVTTGSSYAVGGSPVDKLGRIYQLEFNRANPTGAVRLAVKVNADQVIASGGDTAISPDNVEARGRYVMVQEDGTAESRPVMGSKNRDGSIWRFDLANNFAATRVAQLDPPGRDNVAVGPGIWETSGIIDMESFFGPNTWLFDVQAHSPTAAPSAGSVEDGQLLLMRPVPAG